MPFPPRRSRTTIAAGRSGRTGRLHRAHRFPYDQAYRAAGARLVEIGDGRRCRPWELAIDPLNLDDDELDIVIERLLEVLRS